MPFTYDYPRPSVTVDAVLFRIRQGHIELLLIKRGHPPYAGMWALPGGFIEMQESLIKSMYRELEEETGIRNVVLKQLGAFGAIDRDPRGRTISVAFYGICTLGNSKATAASDASEAHWFKTNELPELAFDHNEIVLKAYSLAIEEKMDLPYEVLEELRTTLRQA